MAVVELLRNISSPALLVPAAEVADIDKDRMGNIQLSKQGY